jgi:hypothetical protein
MDFEPMGVAADLVILTVRDGELQVLLIRRGIEPHKGRWALPAWCPTGSTSSRSRRTANQVAIHAAGW